MTITGINSIAKKVLCALMTALTMASGILFASSVDTDAASASWSNWSVSSITNDNATVSIRVNAPGTVHWTAASGIIYDSNGNVVASKSEGADYYTSYMNIWYDIKGEMGKSLKAGTTYYVAFTAADDTACYISPKYEFKTSGGSTANAANNNSVNDTVNAFLNDSRWVNGSGWGYYQKPKLSTYDSIGCCAYTADFAKYVFGKNSPRDGAAFYSTSDIRSNDILQIDGHWLVVLSRSDNSLTVAEGNVSGSNGACVRVSSDTWTISGNALVNKWEGYGRNLVVGYHF